MKTKHIFSIIALLFTMAISTFTQAQVSGTSVYPRGAVQAIWNERYVPDNTFDSITWNSVVFKDDSVVTFSNYNKALFQVSSTTANFWNKPVSIDTTVAPVASSAFTVNSKSKGALICLMTTVQRNAISQPANGLIVYVTDSSYLSYYNGTHWIKPTVTAVH